MRSAGLDNDLAVLARCGFDASGTKLCEQTLVGRGIGLGLSVDLNVRNAKDTSARTIGELLRKGLCSSLLQLSTSETLGTCCDLVEVELACRSTLASIDCPIFCQPIVPTSDETYLFSGRIRIGGRIERTQGPLGARASFILIGALESPAAHANCCMDLEIYIHRNIGSLVELCQCRAKLFTERSVGPKGVVKDGLCADRGSHNCRKKDGPHHGVERLEERQQEA